MSQNIAIIYTGEIRTLETTIDIFKQNILINEKCHVFAVLQSDNILYYDNFIKKNFDQHLKYIRWFDKNDKTWFNIRDDLCKNMNLDRYWNDYIKYNSGSMIEYYQMYLAYLDLEKYEHNNNIKYDYILRIRCDCVITRPLCFDWKTYDILQIKHICEQIKHMHKFDTIISHDVLTIFMNSIYDITRFNIIENITRKFYNTKTLLFTKDENDFLQYIVEYLNKGEFIITLRENVAYFATRNTFKKIYQLGIKYGKSRTYDDGYWFNSEGQFKSICLDNQIDIFDSSTDKEISSLYEYNKNNYYNKNNELIKNNNILFFLKRS